MKPPRFLVQLELVTDEKTLIRALRLLLRRLARDFSIRCVRAQVEPIVPTTEEEDKNG